MPPTLVVSILGLIVPLAIFVLSRIVTRKVQVKVHRALFYGTSVSSECYFVNVTNESLTREVEVTHVWFQSLPEVHVVRSERPLPKRLKVDETWETWVRVSDLPPTLTDDDVYTIARVQLSTGKVFRSKPNDGVPSVGFVPGGDPPPALSGTFLQPNTHSVVPRPHFAFTRLGYKALLIDDDPRRGVTEAITEDERSDAPMGITLSFTNLASGGGSKRAMNVVARIRLYSEDWSTSLDIPYGVWLNSPCNSTAMEIGAVEELLLLLVKDGEYGALRDLRGLRRAPDSVHFAVEDVPWFHYVRVKLIDQASDTSDEFSYRVWSDNGWWHAQVQVPKNIRMCQVFCVNGHVFL